MISRRGFLKSIIAAGAAVVASEAIPSTEVVRKFGEVSSKFSGAGGYIDEVRLTKGFAEFGSDDFTVEGAFYPDSKAPWVHRAIVRKENMVFHYTDGVLTLVEPYEDQVVQTEWTTISIPTKMS